MTDHLIPKDAARAELRWPAPIEHATRSAWVRGPQPDSSLWPAKVRSQTGKRRNLTLSRADRVGRVVFVAADAQGLALVDLLGKNHLFAIVSLYQEATEFNSSSCFHLMPDVLVIDHVHAHCLVHGIFGFDRLRLAGLLSPTTSAISRAFCALTAIMFRILRLNAARGSWAGRGPKALSEYECRGG